MSNLNISENFTIDDIHKIREYHYHKRKHYTVEELQTELMQSVKKAEKRMDELREINDNTKRKAAQV